EQRVLNCESSREFITAMTYLRGAQDMRLSEPVARQVAMGVAAGCTGAAGRFIGVTDLLKKAGLDSASAMDIGQQAANQSEEAAAAFQSVFKQAFLKSYLDLDLADALRLARQLSLDFAGDASTARDDFTAIVGFCLRPRQLNLPKPACAKLASRIAGYSSRTDEDGDSVAEPFIAAVDFLTDAKDPNLTTGDAMKIAEELVAVSPYAVDNFQQAYAYAVAPSGLKLERSEAVRFAKQIAGHSARNLEVHH
ncbi:MAG: hypothetical protein NTZ90_04320, partial [Proteobacteria bacterium]|nr:hypothetical protein [Pseudomonadota bacterium]